MTDLFVSTNGSDSNAGTKDSPFRTIAHAADVVKSGSTVHVAPGTYAGGFQTTTDGVTYVSDVKGGAKIVPGAGDHRYEAWDNRGDNVTIDGFEIDGTHSQGGTPWLYGVYTGGSNSVVQNMKVHGIAHTSEAMSLANSGGQGGAGIMGDGYYGGSNIKVTGNDVYNIGPDGGSSTLVHGIYMATSGEVSNNNVTWVIGDGITSWHDATNLKITGNNVGWVHGAGVLVGAGDHYNGSGPNDNTQVIDNSITHAAKGIEEDGDTGSNNVYRGNHLTANDTDWVLQSGVRQAAAAADATPDVLAHLQQAAAAAPADAAYVAPVEAHLPVDAMTGFDALAAHGDYSLLSHAA